jgi:hypothetical protein
MLVDGTPAAPMDDALPPSAAQLPAPKTKEEMIATLMEERLPEVLQDAYPRLIMLAHKWFQCELEELLPHEREMLVRARCCTS